MGLFDNITNRLSNVVKGVTDVLTLKGGLTANTGNKTLNAALETAANNPYTTAGVIATGATGLLKTAATSVVSGLSTTAKVIGSGIGIIGVGAAVKSENVRVAAVKAVGSVTPEKLLSYGSTAASVKSGSDLVGLAKSNPVVTSAIAVGGTIIGAKALNAYSTFANTKAVEENTKATTAALKGSSTVSIQPYNPVGGTNKYDVKVAKQETKQAEIAGDVSTTGYESQIDIIKAQTEAQLKLIDAQVAAQGKLNAMQATPTVEQAAKVKKKTTKKKSKTKKKPAKKRKVYKKQKKKIKRK